MPIGMSVVLRFAPADTATAEKVLTEVMQPVRDQPGCLIFELHRSPEDENVLFVYEQYVDESATKAHMASPMFKRIQEEVFPIVEDRQFNQYDTIEA
jgi:quinol monooxygenase YgiN